LRFDSQQAQTFTQFVHPLSRHCGEADYALARSMRATRTHKVFLMNAEHKTPEWLTLVDHTADAGIVVEAPDLARLFERAACGMFCVITDLVAVRAMETSRISIEAPDRAALLVRWLSELNYRHVTEHRVFSKFEVLTLSEHHLGAEVSGEIFDPARHTIFTEIKAVTFHDLQIGHDERGWKAQIIFDL
jgi:SHS2 domain-containing protein